MLVGVEHEFRIGGIAERQPGEDAARLVVLAARREAEHRLVRRRADRPTHDVSGNDAPGDRLARDLLLEQPLELECALTVSREKDWTAAGLFDEPVKCRGDVLISEVERLL